MIFVLQTSKPHYRLRSYADLVRRFPFHYNKVLFYGPMYDGMKDAPPHIIPFFHPGMSLRDVIDKYVGEEPEAIWLFSSSALSKVGRTDFKQFKAPLFLLFTDAVSWDDERLAAMKLHDMKPFKAVFHNYLYKLDDLKSALLSEKYIHYPCWSAHCYDFESNPSSKNLEFLISGVPGGAEYTHRDIFAAAAKRRGLSVQNQLGQRTNEAEDNERFRLDLLRSKYSPHDGGINGRLVPRYAESCFARSVILSPDLGEEMRSGGFENGKNCLLFDRGKYSTPDSCRRLLEETAARRDWHTLADNAYDLAKTRHCTDVRIRKFLETAL